MTEAKRNKFEITLPSRSNTSVQGTYTIANKYANMHSVNRDPSFYGDNRQDKQIP